MKKILVEYRAENAIRRYGLMSLDIKCPYDITHPPLFDQVQTSEGSIVNALKRAIMRHVGWEWAVQRIKENGICVEIGVDHGDGIERALAGKPAVIIGVDPWLSMEWDSWFSQEQSIMDERFRLVERRFADNPVVLERKTSDQFFAELPKEFMADWWFIDGDHREEPCYRDFVNALKFSNPGAWIFGDDIDCARWAKDIGAAYGKLVKTHGHLFDVVWDKSSPLALRVK